LDWRGACNYPDDHRSIHDERGHIIERCKQQLESGSSWTSQPVERLEFVRRSVVLASICGQQSFAAPDRAEDRLCTDTLNAY
jgi:hypothetical protein